MCRRLKNTTVVILADHGLIDSKWVYLEEEPALYQMLRREPSIEPRAASLFVQDGKQAEFARLFRARFGAHFLLLTRQQALESGLFGPGTPNKRLEDFLGDFLAVATGEYSLSVRRRPHELIGMHAGLTEEELRIPLILVECGA